MGLGQNGVVLSFFEPKQRRFGSAYYFFEILPITKRRYFRQSCCKTASFWSSFHKPKTTSFWVSDSCFKTTPFCSSFVQNNAVLLFILKKKRRRFISSRDKTTSFHHVACPKTTSPVRRSNLQQSGEWVGGGAGEDRAFDCRPLGGIEDLT